MNCLWAEGHLSAYLDDALDPQTRQGMRDHLEQCTQCRDALDEYRSLDHLLVAAPRLEPAPDLRNRLFASPEYAALLRQLDHQVVHQQAPHPHLRALPARAVRARYLLPVAAMLTLVLGAALLVKQGLPGNHAISRQGAPLTIGNPGTGGIPLAAGSRVVYARGGALWSAPEDGSRLAQQLTPAGVRVGAWSVSPFTGDAPGQLVAYLDEQTGALHVVRSDGQSDHIVGRISAQAPAAAYWLTPAGRAVAAGLAWSPDGTRISYLAPASSTSSSDALTILHVMNAGGTHDVAVNGAAHALTSPAVWSSDSLRVGYTESDAQGASIWNYSVTLGQGGLVARVPAGAAAAVDQLAWLPSTYDPALTWSVREGQVITGIYTQPVLGTHPVEQLTPDGAAYATVAYSAAQPGGAWLAGDGPTVRLFATGQGRIHSDVQAAAPVTTIIWAPTGESAAVLAGHTLWLWVPGKALMPVAHDIQPGATPAWSADGHRLAFALAHTLISAQVQGGTPQGQAVLVQAPDSDGQALLSWAPDGRSVAVASRYGVLLVSSEGIAATHVETQPTGASALAWSVAG